MNRDLFLAILAMDSYNRGYGAGLKRIAQGNRIGKATVDDESAHDQNRRFRE